MKEDQYLKLESWLKSIDSRLDIIEGNLSVVPKVITKEFNDNSPGLEKLAKFLNCAPVDIHNIISFESEGEFTFLFNIESKKEPEKQFKATLFILTVLYYCYGIEDITANILKKKLEFMGIKSLDHLSDNLKKKNKYIVLKGRSGSSKFKYKITQPGLSEGIILLSEQIKKE